MRTIPNHSHMLAMWDFIKTGPNTGGSMFEIMCSNGWAYTAVQPTGAVHSWCFLWICLYSNLLCSNLKWNYHFIYTIHMYIALVMYTLIKAYNVVEWCMRYSRDICDIITVLFEQESPSFLTFTIFPIVLLLTCDCNRTITPRLTRTRQSPRLPIER